MGGETGRVIVTSRLTEVMIAGEEFDIYPQICPHPLDAINSSKENFKLDGTLRSNLMILISNATN